MKQLIMEWQTKGWLPYVIWFGYVSTLQISWAKRCLMIVSHHKTYVTLVFISSRGLISWSRDFRVWW